MCFDKFFSEDQWQGAAFHSYHSEQLSTRIASEAVLKNVGKLEKICKPQDGIMTCTGSQVMDEGLNYCDCILLATAFNNKHEQQGTGLLQFAKQVV